MNKKEFIKRIAKENEITIGKATEILESILSNIVKAVNEDEKISFVGFGRFEKFTRKARVCVNPNTGEKMQLGERVGIRFKVGSEFKKVLK